MCNLTAWIELSYNIGYFIRRLRRYGLYQITAEEHTAGWKDILYQSFLVIHYRARKVWSMGPVRDNIFNSDSIKAWAHLQIVELTSPGEALQPSKDRANTQQFLHFQIKTLITASTKTDWSSKWK